MTMMNRQSAASTASDCVHCGYAESDVRVRSCPNRCSYHARCLDLIAIVGGRRQTASPTPSPPASSAADGVASLACCAVCPCCSSQATGLELLPLSFAEMDQAHRLSGYKNKGSSDIAAPHGKRVHAELLASDPRASDGSYDPASPRTGKWSDDEIAFRDEMVPHFVEGALPLPDGLKLIEFLSGVLKSKPSRLTKKMKHAKLSTRHFRLDAGYIRSPERARELSRLEAGFVNSISDPVERSEIRFHMRREWRDRLAERLTFLRVQFDAAEWLKSVDVMDRRTALAKSRNRMVKRRFMMGKAMEKDASSPTPGIFIDQSGGNNEEGVDDRDLELLASALGEDDAEDDDLRALCSGPSAAAAAQGAFPTSSRGAAMHEVSEDDSRKSPYIRRFSSVSNASSSTEANAHRDSPPAFRSALLPSLGSAEGPNFRSAAPFLAKVTSYIQHERIPFEHVDIWVPSSSDPVMLDPTGATAPQPSLLGSGSTGTHKEGDKGRLCFAGSASAGVQIVSNYDSEFPAPPMFDHRTKVGCKAVPLSSDEIYHLSLFGSYSEKFSFSSGCGLPGRVFESAVPAWEQFVANAPSHLFERRGGAMQFGIKTALGLPLRSPNVGRIVLVLYSRHNREKDDGLVARLVRDFESLNPVPRWKLMVDMGSASSPLLNSNNSPMAENGQWQQCLNRPDMARLSKMKGQILNLISLLGENMPSDQATPLGQQLHNIMSLRLVLLRTNRSPQDEQLVESIVTLFDSYAQAGRSRPDITLMLARDFAFHARANQQQQRLPPPAALQQGPRFQGQTFLPTMQHLSLGAASTPPRQDPPSFQLDHMHHGPLPRNNSAATSNRSPKSFSNLSKTMAENKIQTNTTRTTMNPSHSSSVSSISSMAERNYSKLEFQVSPKSSASLNRLEGAKQRVPSNDPPTSLSS